jgi:sulfur carrier protein
MQIQLNGEAHTLEPGQSLSQLIADLLLTRDGVAVAVNGEVVPRASRESIELKSGDRVEVIQAVGGG